MPKFTNTEREGEILKKYIRKASQTSLFAKASADNLFNRPLLFLQNIKVQNFRI